MDVLHDFVVAGVKRMHVLMTMYRAGLAWEAKPCSGMPDGVACCASWLDSVSRVETPPSPGLLTSGFFSVPTGEACR